MNLLSVIYPAVCPFCGNVTSENEIKSIGMCYCCETKLKPYSNYFSMEDNVNYLSCDAMYCALKYFGIIKKLMIQYKFNDASYLYKIFSIILNNHLFKHDVYSNIDILTYVPISSKRFSGRGYNQSKLIAKELQKLNPGKFMLLDLLVRKKGNDNKTSSLNLQERKKEKFDFKKNVSITGKRILLLDDILTTGATMEECAKILKDNGAQKVYGAVIASGRRDF